jgi:hypothetical protein
MTKTAKNEEWSKAEIESLMQLPSIEQKAVIASLTEEELETLALAIEAESKSKPINRSKEVLDKRRESSKQANQATRRRGSTVIIPTLTETERKFRENIENDSEAWIWEMCGPESGITQPLTRTFTSQQCEMIGAYEDTLRYGGDDLMLASRGEGKTTYLRAMIWKSQSSGQVDFAALISATGADAKNSGEAIQDMIAKSEPFLKYYPEIAIPCRSVGSISQIANGMHATGERYDAPGVTFTEHPIAFTWTAVEMNYPAVPGSPSNGAMLRLRGADSPIRGLNILGKRPKVIGIDDLDTPETVNNPEVARKVIDRVDLDIGGLGTQTEPLARIMLATLPKQGVGVAHHYAVTGHPFVVRTYKYMVERPIRHDMWMEYVKLRQRGKIAGDKHGRGAHQYFLVNKEMMLAGATVSNEHRFKSQKLKDGSQMQVHAVQNYYDEWADKGEYYCRCEFDNEIIRLENQIISRFESGHVANCETEQPRGIVPSDTDPVVGGIDVRKVELHYAFISREAGRFYRIPDYDVQTHGSSETTVEQAEELILKGLHTLADKMEAGLLLQDGAARMPDLVLVDKGWMGNWTEDGEPKTWAGQPVERFCRERRGRLRRWLPAKGQPNYRSPAPSENVIVGDNWHMNRGLGADRKCTEVIWSAMHYHALVEQLFMTEDERQRFALFYATDGVHKNHARLTKHIKEGSEDLAELKRKTTKSRKSRYRQDHWWDALAQGLVAMSVEQWLRENLIKAKPRRAPTIGASSKPLELGAR